jgi:membrane protein DedA with SNARE-associated domain
VTGLIGQFGALGVFALMVPESACVPVPSEVTLMCAGFGVGAGWMPFWAAVVAATAGNLVGSLLAYGAGRAAAAHGGRPWARRALMRGEPLFERYGNRAVLLARLMPLARSFVSLPAGYAQVPLAPFVAMTALGCAIWATGFTALGLLAGSGWKSLSGPVGYALIGVTALLLIAGLVRGKLRSEPEVGPGQPQHAADLGDGHRADT